jgi:putative toxin-antitoxin system antitoxin component (TIGR02293 family)
MARPDRFLLPTFWFVGRTSRTQTVFSRTLAAPAFLRTCLSEAQLRHTRWRPDTDPTCQPTPPLPTYNRIYALLTIGHFWRTLVQFSNGSLQMKSEDVILRAQPGSAGAAAPSKPAVVIAEAAKAATADLADFVRRETQIYRRSYDFLGGKRFWRHRLASRSDVHSAIVSGIPYASLLFMVEQMKQLEEVEIARALGISARTLRRQSEAPDKTMPADLASKTWLFAETLAKATEVFGSKEDAELWLSRPAMGLDGQKPIDLLQTVQGAELVSDFLGRLEYGVYT